MSLNIWQLAKERLAEKEAKAAAALNEDGVEQRVRGNSNVLICGASKSGKSSFICKFLEKGEPEKGTVALEYSYGRRTRSNVKEVTHLWELGGGDKHLALAHVPLTAANLLQAGVILFVDLSRPYDIWRIVEATLKSCTKVIEEGIRQSSRIDNTLAIKLDERKKARLRDAKEDAKLCSPFILPLIIVGGLYDQFQNFDSEQRTVIGCTLRFIAHYYAASLVFYSPRMEQLSRLGKNLMSHLAFGTSLPKGHVVDVNKPLYVVAGADSFEDIGPPPITEASFSTAQQPLQLWKETFTRRFPPKAEDQAKDDSNNNELFAEQQIDKYIEQRHRDLEQFIRQRKDRQAAEAKANATAAF